MLQQNDDGFEAIKTSSFQCLAAEIRIKIYEEVFKGARAVYKHDGWGTSLSILHTEKTTSHRNILMTSKAIYKDAIGEYRKRADFVLSKGS